ncbi:hypothetical protein Ddye_028553 [Dipteronia dyeriana]|uniref:ATPase AAA-type core domain-containing protein n=1 Tax=Dipteronia dyeriana TaxID=168575 RepID=A0AAD9TD46_9ROSI|nr:hypothetical protein Ddye_028553 [Dipteronia dyeriana]
MSNLQVPNMTREVEFAANIARHHPRNKTTGGEYDRFIEILHKAGEYKANTEKQLQIHRKELEKRRYVLRRALVEYKQIVKDNNGGASDLSEVESRVEEELGEAFVQLVEFMSKTMYIKHDDFVSGVHEAAIMKDYSHILYQLDAKIHDKFKQNPVVGCPEIAKIACDLTRIPASWFIAGDWKERCMRLKQRLIKRVFGKINEIEVIVQALLNKSASWSGRPLGVFMFTGSNNVGKVELARAIAGELYDNEDCLVRFDMSKYDSVSSLVDSITRIVKTRPYSVLVFDKIDKAYCCSNSSVLMLDETLSSVLSSVEFKDTLIIITSDEDGDQVFGGMTRLTELIDDMIVVDWPSDLKGCCRIMLREWERSLNRGVIVCCSKAALIDMEINCGSSGSGGGGATMMERWMEEKVFPVLSRMVSEYDGGVEETIIIHIDKDGETGELSFNFD